MPFMQFLIDLINNFNSVSYGVGGTSIGIVFAILIYYLAKVIKGILDYYYNKLILPLLKKIVIHLPKKLTMMAFDMITDKIADRLEYKISTQIIAEESDYTSDNSDSIKESKKPSKPTQDKDKAELDKALKYFNEENYRVAFEIWEALTKKEKRNVIALFNLGISYETGKGVNQDTKKSMEFYIEAAEQGLAIAQFRLGFFYHFGQNLDRDYEIAAEWYLKAAEQGLAIAQFNIGFFYTFGYGVERNYNNAIKWYLAAAEQGHAGAQNNLGMIYYIGDGVLKSKIDAYIWFSLAITNGNIISRKEFEEVKNELTLDNLQRADAKTAEMTKENSNLIRPQSDFD